MKMILFVPHFCEVVFWQFNWFWGRCRLCTESPGLKRCVDTVMEEQNIDHEIKLPTIRNGETIYSKRF